jgi:hypothetical protein
MAINMEQRRKKLKIQDFTSYSNVYGKTFDEWEDAANHELIMSLSTDYKNDIISFEEMSNALVAVLIGE